MRYLNTQIECDETSSCPCADCEKVNMLVNRVRARTDAKSMEQTLDQFLNAREHDLQIQRTLRQALLEFLESPEPIHPTAKRFEEAGQESSQTFYKCASNGQYWSMIPHAGGFTVSKVTANGYQDSDWYGKIENARAHLRALGARRSLANHPRELTQSLRFKLVNAMSDAYRQLTSGEMSKEVYDRITRELSTKLTEVSIQS